MKITLESEKSDFVMTVNRSDDKKTNILAFSGKLALDENATDTANVLLSRMAGIDPTAFLNRPAEKLDYGATFDPLGMLEISARIAAVRNIPQRELIEMMARALSRYYVDPADVQLRSNVDIIFEDAQMVENRG